MRQRAYIRPMTRTITVAALQLPLPGPVEPNIEAVSALVEEAAAKGAQVILPPELFEGPYFCQVEDEELFATARPTAEHPSVIAMQALAAKLKVAIPTSYFEKDGPHYYNTLAMIGSDGGIMGTYRKSHIPDGPGYEEKYYFRPGNTGFKVWDVFGTRIGVYPTAIGSEPYDVDLDTSRMWRRAMQGHSVSNCMPVIAANRIGPEGDANFYGHSFITDEWGDMTQAFGAAETGVLVETIDLDRAAKHRAGMGFFRDRRPQLYGRLVEDI